MSSNSQDSGATLRDKYDAGWTTIRGWVKDTVEDIREHPLLKDKTFLQMYPIPNGGLVPAVLVCEEFGRSSISAVVAEDPEEADFYVDDLIESGTTKDRHSDKPFFALIDKPNSSLKDKWIVFPWDRLKKIEGPEDNILRLLQFIGEDPTREGLVETPSRVVRSFQQLYSGYKKDPEDVLKTFTEGACDEMVILKDISFYSMCEHHMLPFFGKAHIAYIPKGRIVGLSKLARLLEIYSRRLQVQERLTQEVTAALDSVLMPRGSACVIEGQHFCMMCRGVMQQEAVMTTSSLTGVFKSDPATRAEFLSMVK